MNLKLDFHTEDRLVPYIGRRTRVTPIAPQAVKIADGDFSIGDKNCSHVGNTLE